jgi:BirA family biotin operon repressor/biotin-[acetyl-CoA-carboxylase] ligase
LYKIPAKTLFVGKNLIYVPECHSTNDLASQIGQQLSAAEGTVVITDCQTAGRGQKGSSWNSEPQKNLTFSVVLKPTFLHSNRQFYLNIAISLGVYDVLCQYLKSRTFIKWPNDLIVTNKKIGGILIENQVVGQRITNSIVGIGINVNQHYFPISTATSMHLANNEDFILSDVLELFLERIEFRYLQLRAGKTEVLLNDYLTDFYWKDERHEFGLHGEVFEGTIIGIDDVGRLQIRTNGEIKSFGIKELTFDR